MNIKRFRKCISNSAEGQKKSCFEMELDTLSVYDMAM